MASLARRILCAAALAASAATPSAARAEPPTGAAQPAAAEVDRHARLGRRHFDRGQYQEAIVEYREAYELRADPAFLHEIAESYRQLGIVDRALFFYDRYLDTRPGAPDRAEVESIITDLEQSRRAAIEGGANHRPAAAGPLGDDRRFVALGAGAGGDAPGRARPPLWTRWWLWSAAAALIAAGVTATVLAATGGSGAATPASDLGAKRFY